MTKKKIIVVMVRNNKQEKKFTVLFIQLNDESKNALTGENSEFTIYIKIFLLL